MKTWASLNSYHTLPSKMRCLPSPREGEVVGRAMVPTTVTLAPKVALVSPSTDSTLVAITPRGSRVPPLCRPPRPAVSRSISFSQPQRPDSYTSRHHREAVPRRVGRSQSVYGLQEVPAAPTLPFGSCSSCGSAAWPPVGEEEELPRPEPSPLSKLGYNSIKSRSLLSLHQGGSGGPGPLLWPLSKGRFSSTGHLGPPPGHLGPSGPPQHANILSKSARSSSARNLLLLSEPSQDCKLGSFHKTVEGVKRLKRV